MTRKVRVRRTYGMFVLAIGVSALIVAPGGMAGAADDPDHVNLDAPTASVQFSIPVTVPGVSGITGPFSICIGPTCVTQNTLPSGQPTGTLFVTLTGDSIDTVNLDVDQAACPPAGGVAQEGVVLSFVSSADAIEAVRAEFVPAGSTTGTGVAATNPAGAARNATVSACTSGS